MGFFGNLIGSADSSVLQNGILGRGEITGLQMSGMTLQSGNGLVERKCTITANVYLDNTPVFAATIVQRIQEIIIPQLSSGSAVVAVRVDPNDHSKVAIDFNSAVPEVTLARTTDNAHSAAYLLANGKPIKVVLVADQPLGKKNADGVEMYALQLTAYEGVETPYQLTVGNPVPATALPLLFPGSKLNARLGDDPNSVVVDWAAGAAT
ncbi:MAG TPA: hypothetical protein VGF80_11275 [Galbitalea sp.]|jgi:hypothetical protein